MRNKKFVSAVCVFLAVLMLLSVFVSVIASVGAAAVSQAEIDALEKKKDAIAEQKNAVSVQIAGLQNQQASVLEQKAALDEQNELARQEIELINEQIEIYDGLIEEKEIELEEAIEQEEYQKERFRTRMRAMEENGDLGYMAFIFQATSFADLITRMDNISEILESDKSLEDKYIAAREKVEEVKAEYEAFQADQLVKREEMEERKAELEAQIEEAVELITSLQADIDSFTAEYAKNEAAERELQADIDEMTEQFNKQLEILKQQQQQNQNGSSGQTNTVVTGSGSFMWPSDYRTITSPFGWRIHPIFNTEKYHSGVDVGAANGSPIYAADSGTVQIATYSSSYGNYVVINHGNGYTTLYAHQSSMAVSAGQTVTKGQVIGYVGSTGWSTGPHLHFEITSGGARIDPQSLFSGLTKAY
ncbi:MAG: murein hydrolase activator EnvC family protein [Candidatus Heteroscillospira sp.]|jgi:murein DD-endopeptidase MepM/ murein hydrolase activator NlpD